MTAPSDSGIASNVITANVVTPDDCAACKNCCVFRPESVRYAPKFTGEQKEYLLREVSANPAFNSEVQFSPCGELWDIALLPCASGENEGNFVCPLADKQCRLGENKPLECAAWPFSVVRLAGQLVLTLEESCAVAATKPLSEIRRIAFDAQSGIAKKLFAFARRHPSAIRTYDNQSTILGIIR